MSRTLASSIKKRLRTPNLLLLLVGLWPFLLVNRGVDWTDTGFALARLNDVLRNPGSARFSTALSSWLSALTLLPLASGQWLALRIWGVICYAGIALFTFSVLRHFFSRWAILAALFLSSAIATQFPFIIGYNALSYLFLAAAIHLLVRGLIQNKSWPLVLSGALLGLNIFNRLPNLLHLGLAAAILWYEWFCLGNRKTAWKKTLQFLLPAMLSALLMFLIFLLFLGPSSIYDNMSFVKELATEKSIGSDSSYNLLPMLFGVLWQGGWGFLWSIALLAPCILAGQGLLKAENEQRMRPKALATLGILASIAAFFWGVFISMPYYSRYTFPLVHFSSILAASVFAIGLTAMLWYRKSHPERSLLAAIQLIIQCALPLGTNTSYISYTNYWHYVLASGFGLFICLWNDYRSYRVAQGSQENSSGCAKQKVFTYLIPVALAGYCFLQIGLPSWWHPYQDAPYQELTAPVQGIPVLEGMYTTPANAKALQDYREQVLLHGENRTLLNMGLLAAAEPITDMPLFLSHPYPRLNSYPASQLAYELENNSKNGNLPLITFSDRSHSGCFIDTEDLKDSIILEFMELHSYKLVYEDSTHQIFAPG